jgi:hypothetical protein
MVAGCSARADAGDDGRHRHPRDRENGDADEDHRLSKRVIIIGSCTRFRRDLAAR